jgi:uncharacterized membrane protein
MAKDMSDTMRDALGQVARQALKSATEAASNKGANPLKRKSSPLSGVKGLAAGAGLAAAAPIAYKGVDKLRAIPKAGGAGGLASKAGDSLGSKLKDTVSDKVDEAGGAGGMLKEAASGLLPGGGGGDGGGSGGMPGVGKGRRMPVQQAVDVAVPLETAYNQWTQFEDWPNFMHRVTRVTQEDDCTVSFATKIWGKTKEFSANIETQRPDQRIKWRVSQGITHTGVVTFHELAPRLTRIELTFDVDPGSLIEKAARGMRHVKRAARADMHRFKALIEMAEQETGAWRGVIEDGELVEEHDPSYDEEREYSDIDDLVEAESDSDDEGGDDSEEKDEDREERDEQPRPTRSGRFSRQRGDSGDRSRTATASRSDESREASRPSRQRDGASRSSGRSGNGNGNGSSRSGNGTPSSRRRASSRS